MKSAIKLRGLFLAMAFVLLASMGTAFWAGRVTLALNSRVHRLDEVMDKLQSTLSTMKDVETGQRGFILTGEDIYLKPYDGGVWWKLSPIPTSSNPWRAAGRLPRSGCSGSYHTDCHKAEGIARDDRDPQGKGP